MERDLEFAPGALERMGFMEMLSHLRTRFGARRTTSLLGWSVFFDIAGVENSPTLRAALKEAGYSESAMYRALADFRSFGEYLEGIYGVRYTPEQVIRKIKVLRG